MRNGEEITNAGPGSVQERLVIADASTVTVELSQPKDNWTNLTAVLQVLATAALALIGYHFTQLEDSRNLDLQKAIHGDQYYEEVLRNLATGTPVQRIAAATSAGELASRDLLDAGVPGQSESELFEETDHASEIVQSLLADLSTEENNLAEAAIVKQLGRLAPSSIEPTVEANREAARRFAFSGKRCLTVLTSLPEVGEDQARIELKEMIMGDQPATLGLTTYYPTPPWKISDMLNTTALFDTAHRGFDSLSLNRDAWSKGSARANVEAEFRSNARYLLLTTAALVDELKNPGAAHAREDLSGCVLLCADLTRMDLSNIDLSGSTTVANLTGATVGGNIEGADFKGSFQGDFSKAKCDNKTALPKDAIRPGRANHV